MSEAEIIVCTSEPVWKSRNDEVDRTLSLLILQLRTSRRGLSAGGLLTITNNRILTVSRLVLLIRVEHDRLLR